MTINQIFKMGVGKFKDINTSIKIHYGNDVNILIMIRDFIKIVYTRLRYHFESREYYYYHLNEIPRSEKLKFYPKKFQSNLYFRVNPASARAVATDKYASFLRFKEYYKRDTCAFNPVNDLIDINSGFDEFIMKHPRFIVKPLSANSGSGIKIISPSEYNSSSSLLESLKNEYKDGFIVEELIEQAEAIAQFHPKSVNTIRINTIHVGDEYLIKYPCMRLGRGDAVVDNANAGGIFGGIDVETGKIIAVRDEFGRQYFEHPDTKVKFEGFTVPRWNEVCDLAVKIAQDFSECKIIGFDFALTNKGWVLVEVNAYPLLIFQIATQIGIREEMEQFTEKLMSE